jgi:predicted DNA-binding WGR domain protein
MIRLECTLGNHNKFYELELIRNNGHVFVKALYGRIGQAGQETIVYHGDNFEEAQDEMQKKQIEKQKKGYVVVGNGKTEPVVEKKRPNSRSSGR